jgi:hypothetical protein
MNINKYLVILKDNKDVKLYNDTIIASSLEEAEQKLYKQLLITVSTDYNTLLSDKGFLVGIKKEAKSPYNFSKDLEFNTNFPFTIRAEIL